MTAPLRSRLGMLLQWQGAFILLRGQDVAGGGLGDQLVGVLAQQQTLAHGLLRGSLDSRDIGVVILVAFLQ